MTASYLEPRLHDFVVQDRAQADGAFHVSQSLLVDGVLTPGLYNLDLPWSVQGSRMEGTVLRVHAATDQVEHFRIEGTEVVGGRVGGLLMLAPTDQPWSDVHVLDPDLGEIAVWTEIVTMVHSFSTAFTETDEESATRH